jgi:TolA-binding protein
MSLLAVPIIAALALFLAVLSNIILFISLTKLKSNTNRLDTEMKSTSLLINELQILNDNFQQELTLITATNEQLLNENSQVSKQLEHRIKTVQSQVNQQQLLLEQWQNNQGQDKFYNRAFKLAGKGADVEEIMLECELPRAEVEMLLSVYKQRPGY